MPDDVVIVKGVAPPVRLTDGALKVPDAESPPVIAAVPAAEYAVPLNVSVAVTLRLALDVAAWAIAQANNAVRTRSISSSDTGHPGGTP